MAAHDFVDDEGLRCRTLLVADIVKEGGADFGGRPGAERLLDRHHVIIHRLRQADDGEVIAVRAEIGGKVRSRRVGVVTADGVENGDAVGRQPVSGDAQRIVAFLDQTALGAIGGIGELDAAVADRRAAVTVQQMRLFPHVFVDFDAVTQKYALITRAVSDDVDLGRNVAVTLDQAAHGRRETGRKATRGQHCDFLFGHHGSPFHIYPKTCLANGCDSRV
ncbi:hypothetical protein D3C78_1274750 [compost metagenome]